MAAFRRRLSWLVLAIVLAAAAWMTFQPRGPDPSPSAVRVAWLFEAVGRGAVVSSPLLAEDRIFVGAIEDSSPPRGALYCLNANSGRSVWRFDDAGRMQHMYSSPCLAEGRLYIGEGMHANPQSKLYCVDLAGEELWHFVAQGHIESTPVVAEGCVYFGAGDDGLYCLDARTGNERWHWAGEDHIDATLQISQGRVFGGSGTSRLRRTTEAFCLDAQTGDVVWRTPMELPVWGSPRVDEGQAFFGLGNGRLVKSAEPPETPAGSMVCLAADDGQQLWRFDAADAVLVRPAVDRDRVYFGSRDSYAYCVKRRSGELIWKQSLRSPIVASPALHEGSVYMIGSEGRVCRLNAANGNMEWTFDVAAASGTQPRLFSSPAVSTNTGGNVRIVFGAEVRGWSSSAAVVYCLTEVRGP